MKFIFLSTYLFASLLLVFVSIPFAGTVKAQEIQQLPSSNLLPGNLADTISTLKYMLQELQAENAKLKTGIVLGEERVQQFARNLDELRKQHVQLAFFNDSLNKRNSELSQQLRLRNEMLESQLRLQKEKETLFAEKEQLYKDAINSSIIDKAKLEGQISSRDSRLDGKEREIALLQISIDEKNRNIVEKNSEMQQIISEKTRADQKADTLMNNLYKTEKNLLLTGEQLKYTELKLKDCENRYSSITNKKKKTRVVQGFAIKNYRTPDFALAPKDAANPSVYVISNKNSSNIEFDFVTGASIMLKDLTKPGGNLTYDVGFFLGFGGNNLFKNFYLGPNFKLFDVLHVNIGANVAEYEALKSGFNVGDVLQPGITIPTTKEWKVNGYLGFTFDLDLITMIGKR